MHKHTCLHACDPGTVGGWNEDRWYLLAALVALGTVRDPVSVECVREQGP